MNNLVLDALHCKNSGRTPVWLMRQAGRYMPQYRAIRAKHSFLEMCHDPELASQITLMPIRTFGFDAAILFSDILVIPEALGVGLRFEEAKGPIIERPLETLGDIERLPKIDVHHSLGYVKEAIKLLIPQLKVPLLGFCGAPFTVASYMIEGGTSRDLKKTKQWMLREPASFHKLLDHIATCTIDYINMQAEAGVQALQFFDSWAHVLSHGQFREFSLPYLAKLKNGLKKALPVILFCRGSSVFAPDLAEIHPAAISIDWNGDLQRIRSAIPSSIALQGNLDPDYLYAPRRLLQREIRRVLKQMKGEPGYIFNLGHGIHPDILPDAVKTLVETVQCH